MEQTKMGYILYTGEALAALRTIDATKALDFERQYVALNGAIGLALAEAAECDAIPDTQLDDGRLATAFSPSKPGQPLPNPLAGWDNEDEWED